MVYRYLLLFTVCLLTAFHVNAQDIGTYLTKGGSFLQKMETDSSIHYFKKALELNESNYNARYGLAISYYYAEMYDEAIENFKMLSVFEKNDELYYKLFTNSLINLGKYKEALNIVKYGLSVFPKAAELYEEYGLIYTREGRTDSSKALWRKGAEINPAYPGNYRRLYIYHKGIADYVNSAYYLELALNATNDLNQFKQLNEELFSFHQKAILNSNDIAKIDFLEESMATVILKKSDFHKQYQKAWDMIPENSFSKGTDSISLDELVRLRIKFYENLFTLDRHEKFRHPIYERIQKIINAGLIEAYCYWLLSEGDMDSLKLWAQTNMSEFQTLIKFMAENPIEPEKN